MSGYQLYTYALSSTAWRARIALNLKKIRPEYKFINLFTRLHREGEYTKINPNAGVPSLVLPDGRIIV